MLIVSLLLAVAPEALAQQTCTFTLNPTSRSVPATPDTIGTITVTASSSTCARTAISDSPDWLTISFGNTGTGNGSIGYRVDTSDVAQIRSGSITVGNARFTVTQAAAACTLDINPLSARVTPQAGSGSIRLTTRCRWSAASSVPWLTTTSAGTGDGIVSYSYEANSTTALRTGIITIGTRTFSLTQEGVPCTTTVNPTSADYPGDGGRGVIAVTSNCAWRAAPSQTWIAIEGSATGTNNGSVTYTIASSTIPAPRAGAITIGNQAFTIRQAESTLPRITAIRHLASRSTSVAPGTLAAISGTRLASEEGATRVFIDGTPVDALHASAELVSIAIPSDIEPRRSVDVVVEVAGRQSLPVALTLASAAPGIFSADGSGTGRAVALNADLSFNGPETPARKLSIITLFATGAGKEQPLSAWTLSIGGAVAQVLHAGPVPGLPPGIVQINALIPAASPVGIEVPVFIVAGGAISQSGITLNIQ